MPATLTRAVRLLAAALLAAAATGCGTTYVTKAPSPEDEIARLQRDVNKVRFAIDATKQLIDRSRGQPYVPDLYLRLAELYVEEARYHYFIAYEGQKRRERAVTSVQARLLKTQAVGVYQRILTEFPDFKENDKVLFFIAHEHRELGEYPEMIKFLQRIVDEHPKSLFRNEALLVMGDYHFDKIELDTAEKFYRMILAGAESPSHGMARYKLAWVRINKEDYKGALELFEDAIEGMVDVKAGAGGGTTRRIDLRREALVDLVFPYTEVHKKPKDALEYFKKLADSRTSYLAALAKLANRWFVKGEYGQATAVYRELLAMGMDSEDSVEWAHRLYDGVIKGKSFDKVAQDVDLLGGVLARRRFDWRLSKKERDNLYKEFEAYTRDLATKAQLEAEAKKEPGLYERAADAYEAYLSHFDDSPKAAELRLNLAEARFASKQFLAAGQAYELVLGSVKKEEQEEAFYTAVAAYGNALKETKTLSRLELVQARAGLRRAARDFIDRYPKTEKLVAVKFNLAKTYYDEGAFERAAELFAALVQEYPTAQEASVSAELALDALRAREDYEGLARLGKLLVADARLPDSVKTELNEIIASAEARALDVATLKAGTEGESAAEGLIEYAKTHQGTALGEKALVNAFATARNSDDLEKVAGIGEQLLDQYPRSEAISDVLAVLGKMAAQAVDFERSARYLEESAKRKPNDPSSVETLRAAGTIKAYLGDVAGAQRVFELVLQRASAGQVKREAALQLADILERAGDSAGAARALDTAISEGANTAAMHFRLGHALAHSGGEGEAVRHYRIAIDLGKKNGEPEDLDGAAGAQFYMAGGLFESYSRIGFGGDRAQDGAAIKAKFAALGQLEEAMVGVMQLQSARWALASLGRLAAAYEEGAKFLEDAPAPPGLDAGGVEKYKQALGQKAAELKGKAKEALDTCAGKAAELRVFSPVAKACTSGRSFTEDPFVRPSPPARRGGSVGGEAIELRKRIGKNSKDYEALGRLATLYLQSGDPYAAKLVLDKAAEGGADSATYNLRGVVSYAMGYPQEAYDEFKEALQQDGNNPRARLNLAALYRQYGFERLAKAEASKVAAGKVPGGDPGLIAGAGGGK